MPALVTYEMAVRHLKQEGVLDGSPADADVEAKILQASALVIAHLKRPGEWNVESSAENDDEFAIVQAAVLRVLTNLYYTRGDEQEPRPPVDDGVIRMLSLHRDPSLA